MSNPRTISRPLKSRKQLQPTTATSAVYPFSAIVGQDAMKLGLILNVIDPAIGGVLLMGHRGTGKSTAVRALADLLPEPWVVRGCKYNCDPGNTRQLCSDCAEIFAETEKLPRQRAAVPVVDLPLGATEDRVCGSIDIEHALRDGVKAFEPGLLARANRGFLYIDEVNLLEDHLVDLLLDVAVTGRNKVERENISVEHAARFVLVGSGNPEEGELRPQLLDRFGLYVQVQTENDIDQRVAIVERREAFERDAEKFRAFASVAQDELRRRIDRACKKFTTVRVERKLLRQIAALCSELKVDGHRGELTIMRSARALAAFAGRRSVTEDDVRRVATMALRHRLHRDPLGEQAGSLKIEQALDKAFQSPTKTSNSDDGDGDHSTHNQRVSAEPVGKRGSRSVPSPRAADPLGRNGSGAVAEMPAPPAIDADMPRLAPGHHFRSLSVPRVSSPARHATVRRRSLNQERGRYARAVSVKRIGAQIAFWATLRAALSVRGAPKVADLRYKQFAKKDGMLFIFAIDASGSMALNRINQAKGALLRLLAQSYVNRDRVAIVAFKGTDAEVLLPPSRSVIRARRVLDTLTIGGGTPLSAGLACSLELARAATLQNRGDIRLLLFTDGHANVPLTQGIRNDRIERQSTIKAEVQRLGAELAHSAVNVVVVDTARRPGVNADTREMAGILGAEYVAIG